ncbi:hypothetical protein SUTMEG_15550 [Sutterella megalosphaeroides]|uniref:Uncharacterized protein n=1 Tax=Sutterella megalosphaeroides TaxID=2494234 RepID=A0A2Z6IB81_9BURK|nr:hypothetical protein SUTMEG_15550 [Sutterella megalosphaeroides]
MSLDGVPVVVPMPMKELPAGGAAEGAGACRLRASPRAQARAEARAGERTDRKERRAKERGKKRTRDVGRIGMGDEGLG